MKKPVLSVLLCVLVLLSTIGPVVQISLGKAQSAHGQLPSDNISSTSGSELPNDSASKGQFATVEHRAKDFVENGVVSDDSSPLPSMISQESVGPSLGETFESANETADELSEFFTVSVSSVGPMEPSGSMDENSTASSSTTISRYPLETTNNDDLQPASASDDIMYLDSTWYGFALEIDNDALAPYLYNFKTSVDGAYYPICVGQDLDPWPWSRYYRGFVQWDTSSIPDGSEIISVRLSIYLDPWINPFIGRYVDDYKVDMDFYEMSRKPSSYGRGNPNDNRGRDLFNDAKDGTLYTWYTYVFQGGGWYDINLGSSAAQDLENQLGSDWYAVGFHEFTEREDGTGQDRGVSLLGGGYCYLRVTYTPPPADYDEYFCSVKVNPFDNNGDGYNDAVQVKMDVDTTNGTLMVHVNGYLDNPSGTQIYSDSDSWQISGYSIEYGYIYLYVSGSNPQGWYGVRLYLYDNNWKYEDNYSTSVYLYPPDMISSITVDPNGGRIYVDGAPVTSKTTYSWTIGSTHTLNPDSGYSPSTDKRLLFTQWSDGSTADPRQITVSGDATYRAYWKTQYRLIISVSSAGTGTTNPSAGTYWHDSGSYVTITETPNTGYAFDYWDLDGVNVGIGSSYTVIMNAPHSVTAFFIRNVVVVRGYIYYLDQNNQRKPVSCATVNLYDKTWYGIDRLLTDIYSNPCSTWTNHEGYYEFEPVENVDEIGGSGTLDLYIELLCDSGAVKVVPVLPVNVWPYRGYSTVSWDVHARDSPYTISMTVTDPEKKGCWGIYDAILEAYQATETLFGYRIPKINVVWPWPWTHFADLWLLQYIGIESGYEWDKDVVDHEYGHWVMHQLYGGNVPSVDYGPDGVHYWSSHENAETAWVEGWANFYSVAIRDDRYFWSYDLESQWPTGDDVEGAIACILWDIYDSPATDDDELSMGLAPIWDVMKNYVTSGHHAFNVHESWDGWFARGHDHFQQMWDIFNAHGISKPHLNVWPSSLYFTRSGTQSFNIQNDGGETLTWSASESASWIIDLSPSSGSLSSGQTESVSVTVSVAGLSAGHYSHEISVTSNDGTATITVNLDIPAIIEINPNGGKIYVDDSPITTPTTYAWSIDSTHTLDAESPYILDSNVRLVFTHWNDGNTADPRTITVSASAAYTALWNTQYQLTISVSPSGSGTTNPSTGSYWRNSGTSVTISATPSTGYTFSYWNLDGDNVGTETSYTVSMDSPHSLTAIFSLLTIAVQRWEIVNDYQQRDTMTAYFEQLMHVKKAPIACTIHVYFDTTLDELIQKVSLKFHIPGAAPERVTGEMGKVEPGRYLLSVTMPATVSGGDLADMAYLALELIAAYFGFMLAPPPWYTVPSCPMAYLEEVIVVDVGGKEHIITESATGQSLPSLLPTYCDAIGISVPFWSQEFETTYATMCPLDMLVTDPHGNRIGALYEDGVYVEEINEVPDSFYSGRGLEIEIIILPSIAGEYTVQLFGIGQGYFYMTGLVTNNEEASLSTVSGSVLEGSISKYNSQVSETPKVNFEPLGYAYTNKPTYNESEVVTIGLNNSGNVPIELPSSDPWSILNEIGQVVFQAVGSPPSVVLNPGDIKEWQWDQKDDFGLQVSPGNYLLRIETSAGIYVTGFDIVDVTPPAIDILSPQNTTYSATAIDLNFTVSESTSWIGYTLDGQANITITGNITLADLTEGPHNIIVYANDTYGNMGFSNIVYFTIDTIPPTTSISLSGTLGLDDWYVSDVIVTLTATDEVSGVAITAYSFDGALWFTHTRSFTITDEGVTTIYYNSTDNAGNIEDTKSTTVKIDKTNPMTTIDLAGALGNEGWYLSDVIVTLEASDTVSGILEIEYSFDGDTWIVYATPFTIDTEGTTTVYVRSTDNAGNVETGTFDVKIDKTPPDLVKSLSGTLGNNDWYVSDVTVTLSGSDAVSGLAPIQYSFDGTTWYTYLTPFSISTEGITTLYHKASDIAGNGFVLPPQQIKIDKTPPITTDGLTGTFSNGWYTSDVTITLDNFDATSGVENTYYKIDNGVEQIYLVPFLVSSDGPHTIEFWSTDNAGNIETHNIDTFQIDTTAPITTASLSGTLGLNDWYVTSVQVTLTGEDPGESSIPPTGSGIYKTYYILDGGLQTEYTGPFTVSEQGSHTVQFWSIDIADNTEVPKTTEFKIDTVAPVTTSSQSPDGNNDWWKTSPARATLSASDATSGVMEIHYQVDSGSYVVVPGASALVIVEGNGIHTVNYYVVDYAGNQESEKTETVKIDTISPTTTLGVGSPQFTSGTDLYVTSGTSFTLSPLDNPEGSDVAATYYRVYPVGAMPPPFDSATTFQIIGDDGEYIIEYCSTDNAGNQESLNSETVILDNTPPATTKTVGSPSYDDFVTSATPICLDASDSGADLEGTYYRINGNSWISYAGCFTLSGPDGTYLIEFYSVDNLGNTELVNSQTHQLDNTATSSSDELSGTMGDNDWFVSSVIVTLSADDDSGSGVATVYYILDGGTITTYSAPFVVAGDGWHTIEYWSVDKLENTESPFNVNSFKIDMTAPAISAYADPPIPDGLNGWYTSSVTITLTATDDVSCVAFIYYRINGDPWHIVDVPSPAKTITFIIEEDGIHMVEFYAQDVAGNLSPPVLFTIKVDQTEPISDPPTIGEPHHFEEGVYYISDTTTFALSAIDNLSGVAHIEFSIDDPEGWQIYASPFTVLGMGQHTIYYRSVDMGGNVEEVQTLEIVVNATKLTYVGDVSGQYSDPVIVEAELIEMATQQPISYRTITFAIGTQSVAAHTDGGVASASMILNQPAGEYTVSAKFAGDGNYLESSDEQMFVLHKEKATVEYTGDTVVPTTAKTINLRATIFDSPDSSWGDLTKMNVTFSIYVGLLGASNLYTEIPAVQVSQTDAPGVGVAVIGIDNLPENGYLIVVSIDNNNYYDGPTSAPTPLIVYEPTGSFVTGGGWIWDPSGSKGNFGFNVKYTKSGKPQGHSTYVYREDGWDYVVKSNAWIGLAIEQNHAAFEAKCVIQKYNPETEELVWDEGNYKFRVDVWDNDPEGDVDVYQIGVLDKNGVLFHEAGFDPFGELQGGNIVIHDERKKKP